MSKSMQFQSKEKGKKQKSDIIIVKSYWAVDSSFVESFNLNF